MCLLLRVPRVFIISRRDAAGRRLEGSKMNSRRKARPNTKRFRADTLKPLEFRQIPSGFSLHLVGFDDQRI